MTAAAAASHPQPQAKPDNLLGICAAIGHDVGFDPLWLRVALSAGILWNPVAVLGTYLTLGVLVLATRWLFPDAKPVAAERTAAGQPATAPAFPANEPVALPLAA